MTVKPVPERYQYTVIPHIMIKGASAAIEFYKQAFSATEIFRIAKPTGEIAHAEIKIGNSIIMLGDTTKHFKDSQSLGGTSVGLHVYVDDVDNVFAQAVAAGAIVMEPMQDMFHGDRTAMLKDRSDIYGFF
jgi:PhnB protein